MIGFGQAKNAALLAVQILATADPMLAVALEAYKADLRDQVAGMDASVQAKAAG